MPPPAWLHYVHHNKHFLSSIFPYVVVTLNANLSEVTTIVKPHIAF